MHGDLSWAAKPAALRAVLRPSSGVEILLCPPDYLLPPLVAACAGLDISVGAQNCHQEDQGAFTGEMSARMAADSGAGYVILGHSERRTLFGEGDGLIAQKAAAVMKAGLSPIICVGESRTQRDAGDVNIVVGEQLENSIPQDADGKNIVIAYEPVWAIGTGLVPTLADIAAMHGHIRAMLIARFGAKTAQTIRILYGGSVKPDNAKDILALVDVGGALIGGASLDMQSLAKIAQAAP